MSDAQRDSFTDLIREIVEEVDTIDVMLALTAVLAMRILDFKPGADRDRAVEAVNAGLREALEAARERGR